MNINSLTSARCARLSVGELRSFCSLMPIRPQRGRVRRFFITFFACAKKVTQESTPREPRFPLAPSLAAARGRRHWFKGDVFRHHIDSARRGSIRMPLPRLCKVHLLHWNTSRSAECRVMNAELRMVFEPRLKNRFDFFKFAQCNRQLPPFPRTRKCTSTLHS